ncbi:nucleotidyltransferase domain-containing protein [Ruminococcaceae bacterium OttesenSCG-928-D13]|nr:nucleotidyltransferase domain-containing protein [Ruminococcaceae bacterium OttesenSCG-928-D13]
MGKVYRIDEIRARLHPIFDSAPVHRAILFGSYAKGRATEQSDVDIVIDSKGELLDYNFYGVLEDVTESLGKRVDMFEISEVQVGSPIHEEILTQGVILFDRQG